MTMNYLNTLSYGKSDLLGSKDFNHGERGKNIRKKQAKKAKLRFYKELDKIDKE